MIYKVLVEKRPQFAVDAEKTLSDIRKNLDIKSLESVRLINRYYVEGLNEKYIEKVRNTILSEPPVDLLLEDVPSDADHILAVEYLPGQFDARAASAEICIGLLTEEERPTVLCSKIYCFYGKMTEEEAAAIDKYLINPVECRQADLNDPKTLKRESPTPPPVKVLEGFIGQSREELAETLKEYSLAMDLNDLEFLRNYFKDTEKRDPTITELRILDTYWSDHCRHTTFLTELKNIEIEDDEIRAEYEEYLALREELGIKKPITLMDVATIGAKTLKRRGLLTDMDESEEINACSVKITAKIKDKDGEIKTEPWLLMFKNETHNHPTEIEPFGGAATCLGGAIRDPLSGRSYVYQAMRVTGAADPRRSYKDTIKGKLPQYKITTTAAAGYSSYGNQIGLATGLVDELYHEGYAAKRMEIGAVVGACPEANVRREVPAPGDVVILLGGATGRDGCGGATGSSKSHTLDSINECGAEVQKGNPPEERKLQRLFRNPEVTRLIKRCNDFGAGGVSVAVGELADGLRIDLDKVYKKYDGLDGTELAISESQERMAVVVERGDVDKFLAAANAENLRGEIVAVVTEEPRMVMLWRGGEIVNVSREFLNSNGAKRSVDVAVKAPAHTVKTLENKDFVTEYTDLVSSLNVCSKRGLTERFDSSIGAASVFVPYGGKYQLTPSNVMAAKLPVFRHEGKVADSLTASVMAYGCDPAVLEKSPFHGAQAAVIASVSKLVAAGCSHEKVWLTFQEYFEKPNADKYRYGKPLAALLGALKAQLQLSAASIGGKDSMSGTFENIDVPPTLCSFAVSAADASGLISPEFKAVGSDVNMIAIETDEYGVPCYERLKKVYSKITAAIKAGKITACWPMVNTSPAEAVFKMAVGNKIGFDFNEGFDAFRPVTGFVFEGSACECEVNIGKTKAERNITLGSEKADLEALISEWEKPLEGIFPTKAAPYGSEEKPLAYTEKHSCAPAIKVAKPRVLIPVFMGTNCEYDSAKAFEKAGAESEIIVVRDLTPAAVTESVTAVAEAIKRAQIIMFPGGFSGGDEPEGSGKLIATFFRNPRIAEAVTELYENRDGLILGICNGFQALIKLGLLPYGKICDPTPEAPTLTFNTIGRHRSNLVDTVISSAKSPWLSRCQVGEIYSVPISHGEGRLVCASDEILANLMANGQVATQYVDEFGKVAPHTDANPNGSYHGIEGLLSPDGRIMGKMAHSERFGDDLYKNVPGAHFMDLFGAGVDYFTK